MFVRVEHSYPSSVLAKRRQGALSPAPGNQKRSRSEPLRLLCPSFLGCCLHYSILYEKVKRNLEIQKFFGFSSKRRGTLSHYFCKLCTNREQALAPSLPCLALSGLPRRHMGLFALRRGRTPRGNTAPSSFAKKCLTNRRKSVRITKSPDTKKRRACSSVGRASGSVLCRHSILSCSSLGIHTVHPA